MKIPSLLKIVCFSSLCLLISASTPSPNWMTDYDQAVAKAQQADKAILMVFSGSDWCRPCIQLEQEVFETDTFKALSNAHFVLLKVDFPRAKKNRLSKEQTAQNAQLAEKYNPQGAFPLSVILSNDLVVLGKINGYQARRGEAYLGKIKEFIKQVD